MLDQDIEQSRNQRLAKLRYYIVIGTVSMAVLGSGLFVLTTHTPKSSRDLSVINESPSTGEVKKTTQQIEPQDHGALRKQFQADLVVFEQERQPILDNRELVAWDSQAIAAITRRKDEALSQFAAGQYHDAIATLEQANNDAVDLQHSWQAAYQEKLLQAQQAYQQEDIARAQLFLNQAFSIQVSEAQGLLLQQQIDSYLRVATLLQQLNIAKIENNLSKQVNLLKEIVAEDPTRTDLVSQYQRAKKQLNDLTFSRYIAQGLKAIEQGHINKASIAYENAKRIDSHRNELKNLQQKIAKTQRTLSYDALLVQLENAAKADNWLVVAQLSKTAFGNDQKVQRYRRDANDIIRLQQQAQAYIHRPQRLHDDHIRSQAQAFVRKNMTLTLKSPRLSQQMQALTDLLSKANAEQPLRITSDGNTDIWVLGVGHVGKVQEKIVSLPPGQYTLEGRCEGYRNKQIIVSLSQQQEVSLVCDERIR